MYSYPGSGQPGKWDGNAATANPFPIGPNTNAFARSPHTNTLTSPANVDTFANPADINTNPANLDPNALSHSTDAYRSALAHPGF